MIKRCYVNHLNANENKIAICKMRRLVVEEEGFLFHYDA